MVVNAPDGNNVLMELANGENIVIEFSDENSAILFFEIMKQAAIEAEPKETT